jgi:hypothetical protein
MSLVNALLTLTHCYLLHTLLLYFLLHYYSAFMLVYVRRCDLPTVMCSLQSSASTSVAAAAAAAADAGARSNTTTAAAPSAADAAAGSFGAANSSEASGNDCEGIPAELIERFRADDAAIAQAAQDAAVRTKLIVSNLY